MSSNSSPAKPRKSPCGSCPYRKNVPSGVWDESEYQKLAGYDGETFEQDATATFLCHQADGCACSGWLGHRNPENLLAVRLGLMRGVLDPSCLDYTTDVPLFESGAAAAEHGMKNFRKPREDAMLVISKISCQRSTSSDQIPTRSQ
jgi:hypothetical protein